MRAKYHSNGNSAISIAPIATAVPVNDMPNAESPAVNDGRINQSPVSHMVSNVSVPKKAPASCESTGNSFATPHIRVTNLLSH